MGIGASTPTRRKSLGDSNAENLPALIAPSTSDLSPMPTIPNENDLNLRSLDSKVLTPILTPERLESPTAERLNSPTALSPSALDTQMLESSSELLSNIPDLEDSSKKSIHKVAFPFPIHIDVVNTTTTTNRPSLAYNSDSYTSKSHRKVHSDSLSPTYSPNSRSDRMSLTPSSAHSSTNDKKKIIKRWKMGEQIGKGAFGTVYMGMNLSNGKIIAVKEILFRDNLEDMMQLRAELELLRTLEHPNIVSYYQTEVLDDKLYVLTEWCPGGSISDMLKKFGALEEPIVAIYTKQILLGLEYLHRNNIIHRDIKGANLLVDANGNVKLADFGASKNLNNKKSIDNSQLRGTPYFMAPEVIRQEHYGKPADIWSVGCTVLQMATGNPPWKSMKFENVNALLFYVGTQNKTPPLPEDISDMLHSFLRTCFQRNPHERSKVTDLLNHPFIQSIDEGGGTLDSSDANNNSLLDLDFYIDKMDFERERGDIINVSGDSSSHLKSNKRLEPSTSSLKSYPTIVNISKTKLEGDSDSIEKMKMYFKEKKMEEEKLMSTFESELKVIQSVSIGDSIIRQPSSHTRMNSYEGSSFQTVKVIDETMKNSLTLKKPSPSELENTVIDTAALKRMRQDNLRSEEASKSFRMKKEAQWLKEQEDFQKELLNNKKPHRKSR